MQSHQAFRISSFLSTAGARQVLSMSLLDLPDNTTIQPDSTFCSFEEEEEGEIGDNVPLLEVSSSTGSFRSLPVTDASNEVLLQYKPDKKWVLDFPVAIDDFLRPFDDRIIPLCQFTSNKVVDVICNLITFAVAIEIMFALPFILYSLGVDGLASEFTYLALFLALISQIPKRFIWRYRPWMVQRANKLRSTSTSSFPSRAVCCSVVYAYAICYTYFYFNGVQFIWWWMPELFIVLFLASSFARVFLGVHYPSDCIVGALQGILICLLGTLLWKTNLLGCTSCSENACYSEFNSDEQITASNLGEMSYVPFLIVLVLSAALIIFAVIRPINFWRKCDRSLGLLLPCIAFQTGFLCPGGSTSAGSLSQPMSPPPWWAFPFALGVPAITLLFGHKMKSKYPFFSFLVLYSITFTSLILWRLFVLPLQPSL